MLNPLTLLNASPYALAIKAGMVVLVLGAAFSGGAYSGYRWEHSAVLKLQLADAKYVTAQVQAKADLDAKQAKIDTDAAVGAQKAFDDLHVHYITVTKEITSYVTPIQEARTCITVGLARSLRAAAEGPDAGAPALASGQSDDACSDATAAEVAGWFKAYAEISQHNAIQLNMLEAEVVQLHDSYVKGDAP